MLSLSHNMPGLSHFNRITECCLLCIGSFKMADWDIKIHCSPLFNLIDPKGLPSNMRYFPRISPNSYKIPPKFRVNTQIQSVTNAYLVIKTKGFLLHLMWNFIGFNLIYWSPICGKYILDCSFLEKCGKIWKNGYGRIGEIPHGRLRPDWGLKG